MGQPRCLAPPAGWVRFLQQPGRTTFDTKFDLTADPGAFLDRALHLWNPSPFGALQNQAYGYLFPQGPFFLGADVLSVPDWVAQRLWSALLLVAAYEGTRRVGRALGIPAWAAGLGGLGYALAPRLLGAVGVLSGEVLPTARAPVGRAAAGARRSPGGSSARRGRAAVRGRRALHGRRQRHGHAGGAPPRLAARGEPPAAP